MKRIFVWCTFFIISTFLYVHAQNINLSGVVSNSNGEAVSGAIITLVGLNINDTTDANGAYSINATGVIADNPILPMRQHIALTGGVLSISLTEASPVVIELFDMRGNLLDRITRAVTAGEYHFNIAHHQYAVRMLLLRINIGGKQTIMQYMPTINSVSRQQMITTSTSSGSILAKIHAVIDTLKVNASGYLQVTVGIESYESVKNISLEAETALDKFSFFVTSMAGLQELSGSENGFGGDFRFGKTGQGAGLLGADSICSCLAEMSMPGSSVKKWSAFLSAEKGVDGNQVNAIDRIGEGPWYDRMGRLFANNKSELLNARPINADEAIINDLPNEYGIPNHRPDPTQSVVDNHMTVTGSDTLGRLYTGGGGGPSAGGGRGVSDSGSVYGYTCNDWTSTTVRATPRVGMCWPQAMDRGMKNWISSMNASGCEAGIDLNPATGAGKKGIYTIGNGGGYGGFYCFAHKP